MPFIRGPQESSVNGRNATPHKLSNCLPTKHILLQNLVSLFAAFQIVEHWIMKGDLIKTYTILTGLDWLGAEMINLTVLVDSQAEQSQH